MGDPPLEAEEVRVGAQRIGGRPLAAAEEFLSALHGRSSDRASCRLAGRLGSERVARGTPLGAPDLSVAAISLRHSERLLTRDRRFARVRGLQMETD